MVDNCKEKLEANIRTLLEELQNSLSEQSEQHERACVDQITLKERELVAAVHAWNNGDKSIATEASNGKTRIVDIVMLLFA